MSRKALQTEWKAESVEDLHDRWFYEVSAHAREALPSLKRLPKVRGQLRFHLWPYDGGLVITALLMEPDEKHEMGRLHTASTRHSSRRMEPHEVQDLMDSLKPRLAMVTERLAKGTRGVRLRRPTSTGVYLGANDVPLVSERRDH